MLLKEKNRGELVEVLSTKDLINPYSADLVGRYNHGEEAQDPETFHKSDLIFLSGEPLPECWTNSHYREHDLIR